MQSIPGGILFIVDLHFSTVPVLSELKNYVYEGNGGQNSFVYHIEFGVAFKAQANIRAFFVLQGSDILKMTLLTCFAGVSKRGA